MEGRVAKVMICMRFIGQIIIGYRSLINDATVASCMFRIGAGMGAILFGSGVTIATDGR